MPVDRRLVERAPESFDALARLLIEGLHWPVPPEMEPAEALVDWDPEELHLDPDAVARLTSIRQMRPLQTGQPFGVFFLTFEEGRLPVGALRRLVDRLVRKKRPSGPGTHPVWGLDDLLFVVQSSGGTRSVHFVAFKETAGKQTLKVLSWGTSSTPTRIDLLAQRLEALTWPSAGAWDDEWRDRWRGVFTVGHREGIRSAEILAVRMADVAKDVRDEVLALHEVETDDGPIRSLLADVREQLLHDLTPQRFADMYAQTMVYGLLTARVTHPEDFKAEGVTAILKFENPFLDAVYARFREQTGETFDIDELGLRDLADELGKTDIDDVLADFGAANRRDDPVVHFYEDFLARYDPEQRIRLGAFYTPTPVVQYIVRTVDRFLKERFGLLLGAADRTTWAELAERLPDIDLPEGVDPEAPVVSMVDPATGTGTFLVEWIRVARENVLADGVARGLSDREGEERWHEWLRDVVLPRMNALEISLASYAVAHLKVSLLLPDDIRAAKRLPIFLGDTLAAPRDERPFEEMRDPVSLEGLEAERVKFGTHQTIVLGNPPYDRVTQDAVTGWLVEPGPSGASPLDDIRRPAIDNTIFSHVASLYNLYVYFWRWALWKAFEQNNGPGVVSFITASSWLTGPGFLGLRQLARRLADEIWIVDLGGDNRGAHPEENVFDIETPVAIVTLVRVGSGDVATPANARYRRIKGSRQEKLSVLELLGEGSVPDSDWMQVSEDWFAALAPPSGGAAWQEFPALTELFPWQQPGCMFNRTWPISPDPESLERRWSMFVGTLDPIERARLFVTPPTGRNIRTAVAGMTRLIDLGADSVHEPIVRYAYRSFDTEWAFNDPRLAALERPSLWASLSNKQCFMSSLLTQRLGRGPAATASVAVPDRNFFCGRAGAVIPLLRTASGDPNISPDTVELISASHREINSEAAQVDGRNLFAYSYGVLAGADYTDRFEEELATPGPRVPLSADPDLFKEMSDHGLELLWLHTNGERFDLPARHWRSTRADYSIVWATPVTMMPESLNDVAYDAHDRTLTIGDGVISGILPEVWSFEVSGMQVVRKWLGYRTLRGAGRAARGKSPLDAIRPTSWHPEWSEELIDLLVVLTRTIELQPRGIELLDRILAGPLIAASDLPPVPDHLRKPPKVDRTRLQLAMADGE
jgi:hypothetical protein